MGIEISAALTGAHLILSAKSFGAVGDGVTDDTAAFTAMTAYADAQSYAPVFDLEAGSSYIVSSTLVINMAKMGVRGNGAQISAPSIAAGTPVVWANAYGVTTDSIRRTEFSGLDVIGTGRDFDAVGLRLHSDSAGGTGSVRASIRNVRTRGFKYGVSVKNKAYLSDFQGFDIGQCKYGIYQEASPSDFAENTSFGYGCIHDCDVLVHNLYGNIWRFYATSFDYFGDSTGSRVTADDRLFNLGGGSQLYLDNCHLEWNYGKFAGQTNNPINILNANTALIVNGGRWFYAGGQVPLYAQPIMTSNSSQMVRMRDVRVAYLGWTSAVDAVDALIGHTAGAAALVQCSGLTSDRASNGDLPAAVCFANGLLRNGMDDPFQELGFRATFANSTAQTSTTLPFGTVSVTATPNGQTKCTRLTGPGTATSIVRLSLPVYDFQMGMWCFFLEGGNGVGSITVRERATNGILRASTSGVCEVATDGRGVFSSSTKTVTLGTAGWQRVSWKDVWSGPNYQQRRAHNYTTIEIDISGMSSGYVMLGDLTYNQN